MPSVYSQTQNYPDHGGDGDKKMMSIFSQPQVHRDHGVDDDQNMLPEHQSLELPAYVDKSDNQEPKKPTLDGQHFSYFGSSPRGGWKGTYFVLGNEVTDRLINDGLHYNLVSYFKDVYNMSQVGAATSTILIFGTSNLATLIGAYVADVLLGRFNTILLASFVKLAGCLLLMTTALAPALTPSNDDPASAGQLLFLSLALCCIILAVGGIRPCSYAFGADQFKSGDKINTQSYFNWYFFALYVGSLIGSTGLIYIQDNVGWDWGFGVPSIVAGVGIIVLLVGIPLYRHIPPLRSPYGGFLRVLVACIIKKNSPLPSNSDDLYRGSEKEDQFNTSLCHTDHLKCLDRAAVKTEKDFDRYGKLRSRFRLCTVQEVEELKALVNLLPILLIDMLVTTVLADQSGGFYVFQARTMNRHMFGHSFQIPAASIIVFTSLTHVLWMPIYDKLIVPFLRRRTGDPRGITLLQRLGIGIFLSVVALVVSGVVETKRRSLAYQQEFSKAILPLSVFWLGPQLCIKGLSDAFRAVAQLEFLHNQLPANMHALGGAIYWCSKGIGHFIGILLLQLVHKYSKHHNHEDWLADNLTDGHLDYFFYLLGVLQFVFFILFLFVSRFYTYK